MTRKSPASARRAAPLDLAIEALGAQGDGIATVGGKQIFVPYTLPGDRVTARPIGPHHALPIVWHSRAPAHARPACPHFGVCGGCVLQHLDPAAYTRWKLAQLETALARRGLHDVPITPLAQTPPGARRRADFGVARRGERIDIGFHAYKSPALVDLDRCPVLEPKLSALLAPLRELFAALLVGKTRADILVTATETGPDLLIAGLPAPDRAQREALAAFAAANDIARIAWREADEAPDIIVQRRAPRMTFAGVAVALPPGAFLQASAAGEQAIVDAVMAATDGAKRVLDLFAGCGTLTFPLARQARVHAIEGAAALAAALDRAARGAGLGGALRVETRDLSRRPLLREELSGFDAVVFDPPRDGAAAQAAELAHSRVPVVVGVSCNPATFARDARTLVDGGYRLLGVTPIDQFLWSPHLELVGVFRR